MVLQPLLYSGISVLEVVYYVLKVPLHPNLHLLLGAVLRRRLLGRNNTEQAAESQQKIQSLVVVVVVVVVLLTVSCLI